MNNIRLRLSPVVIPILLLCLASCHASAQSPESAGSLPSEIKAIFDAPRYKGAIWGLRVIDLEGQTPLINIKPHHQFFIGSVRKVFSVGELMNQVGPGHRFDTSIYAQGSVSDAGVLQGNLVLVASGDLTMGGRTRPDGSVAYSDFDHNEANSLGNAVLTRPDPLAGYTDLADQIAARGITRINGEVVIDDRLFQPFNFRGEFDVKPIFVNDDVVDLIINPTNLGELASLEYRPQSAALAVVNEVTMSAAGTAISIVPGVPQCIGQPGCTATLTGNLPVGFVPPLAARYPLIRTFRIADPASYARTVLIEKLLADGITVNAPVVEPNPTQILPPTDGYNPNMRVAKLRGLPYSETAKLINKVSYNIGADTSIVLYGLTQGVDDMASALVAEQKNLRTNYGIDPSEYFFIDGSGGGDSTATNVAVTRMLADMYAAPVFRDYVAGFPILGVDGSLASVNQFEQNPTLAPAKSHIKAKPGTYVEGPLIKGQSLAGYINTKSGRKLVYEVVVNNVPLNSFDDLIQAFQDEGIISAILWRDY